MAGSEGTVSNIARSLSEVTAACMSGTELLFRLTSFPIIQRLPRVSLWRTKIKAIVVLAYDRTADI